MKIDNAMVGVGGVGVGSSTVLIRRVDRTAFVNLQSGTDGDRKMPGGIQWGAFVGPRKRRCNDTRSTNLKY